MSHLGRVGLGLMGGRMTGRPMDPGRSVVGPNRMPSKAERVVQAGRSLAERPHPIAEGPGLLFAIATTPLTAVLPAPDLDGDPKRTTAPLISRDSGSSLAPATPPARV